MWPSERSNKGNVEGRIIAKANNDAGWHNFQFSNILVAKK